MEMVIGFEHLQGKHSGRNMANVVLSTLRACGINKDRILTVTSDNASNNTTLVQAMMEANRILDSELGQLSRVPCLAHVIQLALKDLVTHLKIKPKNNKIITEWNEEENDREKHSEARRQDGIPWTLKKVSWCQIVLH
jgi:hypothetical protein